MESQKPILDIIIPVYGRHGHLYELLNNISRLIIKSTLDNVVRLYIVDDCSLSRVVIPSDIGCCSLMRNEKNIGAPRSRRNGFHASSAPFIHFHDSDDSVSESWLINVIESLIQKPLTDILLTARLDVDVQNSRHKTQKFYNKNHLDKKRIEKRLIYRNCMGPLGGVTFSRRVLEKIEFKNFASCQDWQMYIDAIKHAEVLVSRPDTKFIFNKTGDDRISHNPRKKILGHLQLSKITAKESIFKRNIRLFYLYTCKQHIYNKGGQILKFYKKNRIKIVITFLIVSVYWRLT